MRWPFGSGNRVRRGDRPASPELELETFQAEMLAACEETVYRHVFENGNREVGGVLVGRKTLTGRLPRITAAIEAISADEQRATLTFTQEAWEHVHGVIERHYPRGEIVGWYHSHPGFGIFLSEHDLFIHNNFFGDHSQVALVVDPHAGTEGVFTWQEGRVTELYERRTPKGWSDVSLKELEQDSGAVRHRIRSSRGRQYRYPYLVLALVAGLVGGVLLWGAFGSDDPVAPPTAPATRGQSVTDGGGSTGETGSRGTNDAAATGETAPGTEEGQP